MKWGVIVDCTFKNDIEMLSTVGCGIATGNADDEVKEYANKVTETADNDADAVGIKKFIFNTSCFSILIYSQNSSLV